MPVCDYAFQLALLKLYRGQRDGGDSLHKDADEDVKSEHGAEPGGIKTDQPVVSGYREGDSKHGNEEDCISRKALVRRQAHFWFPVLGERNAAKEKNENGPHQEHRDDAS